LKKLWNQLEVTPAETSSRLGIRLYEIHLSWYPALQWVRSVAGGFKKRKSWLMIQEMKELVAQVGIETDSTSIIN